jgi:hypothetical protein
VIVNQTMARTLWPGEDVIGKTVWLDGCPGDVPRPGTVIGLARDAKYEGLSEEPQAFYYVSRRQGPGGNGFFSLILRTAGDPRQWIKPVLDVVQRRGGDLRIYDNGALENAVALSLWELKWQASLLAALGLLAIVLAAIRLRRGERGEEGKSEASAEHSVFSSNQLIASRILPRGAFRLAAGKPACAASSANRGSPRRESKVGMASSVTRMTR